MDAARAVLIVDDDPSVLETMRVLLEGRAGFRVLTALGTRGALRQLHAQDGLAALLVDVDPADENAGAALCHEAIRRHPAVSLVAMSADGPAVPALPSSAVLLRKPFGARELLAAMDQAGQLARSRHATTGPD